MANKINLLGSVLSKTTLVAATAVFVFNFFGAHAQHGDEVVGHDDHNTSHHGEGEESHEGFKPGEFIMHHVADGHQMEWANFQIPLPVMLWTDDGFTCFSSSNFYKEENEAHVHGMEGHAFTMGNEYIMVNEVIYYLSLIHI